MPEEILNKLLTYGCNLNDLFDAELDFLLTVSNEAPEAMKGANDYE